MWVVCVDMDYYPVVTQYETYEEAKAAYDKELEYNIGNESVVYLCEVKESKSFRG